jgi:hypothetical protein
MIAIHSAITWQRIGAKVSETVKRHASYLSVVAMRFAKSWHGSNGLSIHSVQGVLGGETALAEGAGTTATVTVARAVARDHAFPW